MNLIVLGLVSPYLITLGLASGTAPAVIVYGAIAGDAVAATRSTRIAASSTATRLPSIGTHQRVNAPTGRRRN